MSAKKYESSEGVFGKDQFLGQECFAHYQDQGWVLLKGFYDTRKDILPVHQEMNELIRLKLNKLNLSPVDPPELETIRQNDFLKICATNRDEGGDIYRATRHLLSLHRLLIREENLALARFLMETEYVNVIPYIPIRIDIQGEEKYLFEWHQDYPYIQGSPDSVIFWAPLFDVEEGKGGVKLIPESHKQGVRKVKLVDPFNENRNGAHTIQLEGSEDLDREDAWYMNMEAGDALVFSTLLLHKSIPMDQGKIRWTTQIRYANFSHEDAVQRGWPNGMIEGCRFEEKHPEFVINPDNFKSSKFN